MTDFKVGDKVRIVKTNWAGKEGMVVTATDHSAYPFRVVSTEGYEGVFHADELELVGPALKFKVGDKVRQMQGVHGHDLKDTLTVAKCYTHEPHDYAYGHTVIVRNQDGVKLAYKPSELELVPVAKPAFYPYSAGGWSPNATAFTLKAPAEDNGHYGGKDNPYEVIKVAEAWGFHDNAYLFNALKYLGRCEHKGRKVEDLKKLIDYAEREIALEEAK